MAASRSENCIDLHQLERYAAGQLAGLDADRCELHLESCERCCTALADCFESGQVQLAAAPRLSDQQGDHVSASAVALGVWRRMQGMGDHVQSKASVPEDPKRIHGSQDEPCKSSSQVTRLDQWMSAATPPVARDAQSAVVSDMPAAFVGRYRLDQLLGAGGSGCVYLAFDERLKRRVAIKLPHPGIIESQSHIELLLAEAQTVASLDHPGIAPIYDVGSAEGQRWFLVTKLIEGTNLAERLRRGAVAEVDAVRWTMDIAEALQYAHDQGVIHRDIKPQNILLDDSGRVFLTDFGLAWRLNDTRQQYPRAGTPAYMSPEQFGRIDAAIDHRTDIYSLGRVMQELLGPGTSPALLKIIEHATGLEPAARYASAAHMASELRSYLESRGWSAVAAAEQGALALPASALESEASAALASSPDVTSSAALNAASGDSSSSVDSARSTVSDCASTDSNNYHTNGSSNGPLTKSSTSDIFYRRPFIQSLGVLTACAIAALGIVMGWSYWQDSKNEALVMQELLSSTPHSLPMCAEAARKCGRPVLAELTRVSAVGDPAQQLRAKVALMASEPQHVPEVVQAMITADAELSAALAVALAPHAEKVASQVWAIATDPLTRPCARLNAAMYLARTCSDDSRWSDIEFQKLLAECLLQDDLNVIGVRSRALDKLRAEIVSGIRMLLSRDNDSVIGSQRILVYDVWHAFVRNDIPRTVDLLVECPPIAFEKVLDRLEGDPTTIECLRAKLRSVDSGPHLIHSGPLHAHFPAAIALLKFGHVDDFLELWQHVPHLERPDMIISNIAYPPLSREFLYRLLVDRRMLEPLAECPTEWNDRLFGTALSLRRSLLMGVMRPSRSSKLGDEAVADLAERLRPLAASERDSGMRSMAEYALRQLSPTASGPIATGQSAAVDVLPLQAPPDTKDAPALWSVNSLGRIMVHVHDAPLIDHAYAIGQCEMERELFERFLKETGYAWRSSSNSETAVAGDCSQYPQADVSWYDCAAFCNWLSRREGLAECYLPNADGEYAAGMRLKSNYLTLSGYRLPLAAEWHAACAAGAQTRYAFGNNYNFLVRYAWMLPTSSGSPTRVGQLCPNALGLFDAHGNLREWTLDNASEQPSPLVIHDDQMREHRGGDYSAADFELFQVDHVEQSTPQTRRATVGFRLARTLAQP